LSISTFLLSIDSYKVLRPFGGHTSPIVTKYAFRYVQSAYAATVPEHPDGSDFLSKAGISDTLCSAPNTYWGFCSCSLFREPANRDLLFEVPSQKLIRARCRPLKLAGLSVSDIQLHTGSVRGETYRSALTVAFYPGGARGMPLINSKDLRD